VENPSPIQRVALLPPTPEPETNGSRPEDGNYEDDPEAGIFWGPKQPNGMMTRWSRAWFGALGAENLGRQTEKPGSPFDISEAKALGEIRQILVVHFVFTQVNKHPLPAAS